MLVMSPPPPSRCLERPYPASQKGGTLIAEDVSDFATHLQRLADPDGYRPVCCLRCFHQRLHAHDFRERHPKHDPEHPVVPTRRYRCAHPDCRAIWQVLPLPMARCLHHSWEVVETTLAGIRPAALPSVPKRTVKRWRQRLQSSARRPVSLLASSGEPRWEKLAGKLGLDATRGALLAAWHQGAASLAALVHRLVPGVRLM